jgi:opacity protein-like surface antigen
VYSKVSKAQYYFYNDNYYYSPIIFELGGSLGAMNCLTDLGGAKGIGKPFLKDLNYGKTYTTAGGYLDCVFKSAIGIRLEAAFGKVSADDAVLEYLPDNDIAKTRYNRNCNFQSNITEFSAITEWYPLYLFINWSVSDKNPPSFSPYVLGGVGYYSFNPQANVAGRLIDLQPLSTEGQGFPQYPSKEPYKLKQINFPVGAGVKYELSSLVTLRGEFVYRILTTDYLDDVSTTYVDPSLYALNGFSGVKLSNALLLSDRQINQITKPGGKRGSAAQKDSYFSFNFKVGINLGRERIR